MDTDHTDSEGDSFSATFALNSPVYAMYQAVRDLSLNNADYFQSDDSENGQRLRAALIALIDHVIIATPLVEHVRKVAPQYDFDAKTPANGYRSFVAVVDVSILHCVKLNRQIIDTRDSFLFRKGHFMREIEASSQLMASLATCMEHLKTLISWSHDGDLFPNENHSSEELLKLGETINMYCFYGRCLGFQFCESMQSILKTISISMATFSEVYYSSGGVLARATNSVWTGSKYIMDPELRARRIVNISQYASVDFCKSFWLLAESEILQRVPAIVCPAVAVNKVISIPPEPLEHVNANGDVIQIPIPSAHVGPAPIVVRLISAKRREGMISEGAEAGSGAGILPPSSSLIVHCHGGGFVAQSSKSHEIYLRDWANQLNVPILSIDYSLAPAAPFPRALEEVLYAYCWALKNCRLLGTTAEHVVLAGDSAGANLNLGAAMKCVELGLRPPAGIFLAYVPVLVSFVPSPSRLLCLMDPLLPFGFMLRCLKAYACPKDDNSETPNANTKPRLKSLELLKPTNGSSNGGSSDTESFEEVSESDLLELAAHKSPLSENSDTLKSTFSLSSIQSRPEADQYLQRTDDGAHDATTPADNQSKRYVSEFIEKYVLDSEIDAEGKTVPVLRMENEAEEHVLFELPQDLGLHTKFERAMGSLSNGISTTLSLMSSSVRRSTDTLMTTSASTDSRSADWTPTQSPGGSNIAALDTLVHRSPSEEFKFSVPRDPYLSPYWATDQVLAQLPAVSILTVQYDPCLDDCVMFARKLKRLGNETTLDILEGLPHGFLNFAMLSKEAHIGSNLCVQRIKELFDRAVLKAAPPSDV